MAEELGAAVLRVTVDTRQATQALEAFRTQFSQQLGDLGKINFSGIDKGAADAGAKAGAAIRSSLQQALNNGGAVQLPQVKAPDLRNVREALDISGQLNATLADLRAYQKGLEAVRESASATDPLFKRLTATISETRNAIKAFESGTGDLVESLARVKNTAAGLTFAPQLAALDAFRSGLKAVASTALDTTKAVAGIAAKGAVETLKVPIFGLPKDATAAIDKARAQIERLQKQAETTSGKVARLTEGVATLGAGGVAAKGIVDLLGGIGDQAGTTASLLGGVADALNSLPGPLRGLGGIADIFASGTTSIQQWVAGVLQAQTQLSAFTGPLQAVTDSLTALGPEAALVGGALAFTFAGFQDLINQSFKPGVEGARKALRGMTDDTQRLLEALARASEAAKGLASLRDLRLAQRDAVDRAEAAPVGSDENLQATQELVQLNKLISSEKQKQFYLEQKLTLGERERAQIAQRLRDAASPAAPLALPSSDLLQQRVLSTGSRAPQRLSPDTLNAVNNAGLDLAEQYTRQLEAGARAVKSQRDQYIAVQAEASKLLETDLRRQQILNSIARQRTGGGGFGAASAANFGATDDPVQKSIRRNREKTAAAAERALKAEERAAKATEDAARAAELRARREKALQQFRDNSAVATGRASPIDGRLGQDRFIPGSPAFREDRRKRLGEAGSNALIGGAFPLLFGQGIGASIGGAAGGGLGGFAGGQLGFGLSLLGTAVGAQFDLATQKAGTLAAALKDPIGRFSELQQAGLLSSKGLERQVEALISTGRAAEAAALIQQDLANTYGRSQEASELAKQSDELGRTWTRLTVQLADAASGPLASALASTSEALRGFAAVVQLVGKSLPNVDNVPGGKQLRKGLQDSPFFNPVFGGIGVAAIVSQGKNLNRLFGGLFGNKGGDKPSPQVQAAVAAQKELTRLTQQQAVAEASGNRVLAVGTQLIAARVKLQQDLAALSEEERRGPKGDQLRQQYQQTVAVTQAQAKAAADGAERELAATRQLLGLSGDALAFEQERLRIAEARRQSDKAAADLAKVKADPNADAGAIQAVANLAKAQRAEYEKQVQLALNSSTTQLATSERELANTRQLIGLEGERLSIRQEQQRVAQAESEFNSLDTQFRQQYGGISPNTLSGTELDAYKAAYNFREAAEARLEQTRITALERIRRAEEAIADQRRSVEERISNARAGAGLTGLGRGVLADQSAYKQEQINAARAQQRANENPGNTALAEQARDARRSLVAAGEELKVKMQDAFESAKQAVRSITRAIEDAKLNLAQARGGTGGVNQFLSPDQVNARAAQEAPGLRDEVTRLAKALGVIPRFFGSLAQRNDQMSEFIRAARNEIRAPEDISQLYSDLAKANGDLNVATQGLINSNAGLQASIGTLGTKIAELTGKQWNVDVTVNGGSAAIKTF